NSKARAGTVGELARGYERGAGSRPHLPHRWGDVALCHLPNRARISRCPCGQPAHRCPSPKPVDRRPPVVWTRTEYTYVDAVMLPEATGSPGLTSSAASSSVGKMLFRL